jgi:hypothetical protein
MPIEPQPLTTAEVAQHFKRSVFTVRRWAQLGYIRPLSGTRPYLFPVSELVRRENQLRVVDLGF